MNLIVLHDEIPISAKVGQTIRIAEQAMAGSEFKFRLEGPAKQTRHVNTSSFRQGKCQIGTNNEEFEFQTTASGTVKVMVECNRPGPGQVTAIEYTVEVE